MRKQIGLKPDKIEELEARIRELEAMLGYMGGKLGVWNKLLSEALRIVINFQNKNLIPEEHSFELRYLRSILEQVIEEQQKLIKG